MLTSAIQLNILHWEWVDPPWELPAYIGDFTWALQSMKAWIVTGGISDSMTVDPIATTFPNDTRPPPETEGESEVQGSDVEPDKKLPTPCQLVSKVWCLDQVEHTLNKGVWVAMPALHQEWKIFIAVSDTIPFPILSLIFHIQGKLMEWVLRCQRCQTLHHKCYSLANKVCGWCQCNKKTCHNVVIEDEFPLFFFVIQVLK